MTVSLSEAAKLRISAIEEERSQYMSALAKRKHAKLSKEERRANAMKMVEARNKKRKLSKIPR